MILLGGGTALIFLRGSGNPALPAVALAAGLLIGATPLSVGTLAAATPQSSAFLQLDDLKGDSADVAHTGAIDLSSVGPSALLPPRTGTEGFGPFQLTKSIDRATPALFDAAVSGHRFKCGFIFLTRSSHYAYATFALSDVTISGFSQQGEGSRGPTEKIELSYRVILWQYQPLGADGSPQGSVVVRGWDAQTKKAIQP